MPPVAIPGVAIAMRLCSRPCTTPVRVYRRSSDSTWKTCSLGQLPRYVFTGKGRKERVIPLWKGTRRQLADWIRRISRTDGSPSFPSRRSERLTRVGVRSRLDAALAIARQTCASLRDRRSSPASHSAFNGDAPSSIGGRHHRNRSLARTREHRHHTHVRRGRSDDEKTRDRQNHLIGPGDLGVTSPATAFSPSWKHCDYV